MHLLFPGRHIVNTAFQEDYLMQVLKAPLKSLAFINAPPDGLENETLDTIVFAITSSNSENSRYNPVPFANRSVAVDRFGRQFNQIGVRHRITDIPEYGRNSRFAEFTLKEILEKTEHELNLTPQNTIVLCSTPEVIELYKSLDFGILPAELDLTTGRYKAPIPIEVVRMIAEAGEGWKTDGRIRKTLSAATFSAFLDAPEVPKKIIRLYRDPLLTEEGSLTETRDYGTYVFSMGRKGAAERKYADIRAVIKAGRIADHGCADGSLIQLMARDHTGSDFYGIDASGEMIALAKERQRKGDFDTSRIGPGTFVFFRQGNIIDPLFSGPTLDTITSLSLAHEVWSYGSQQSSLDQYLRAAYNQLVRGGRLVMRDVVGPEDKEQEIYLWCNAEDGSNDNIFAAFERTVEGNAMLNDHVKGLSTRARFARFAEDFLSERRRNGRRGPETKISYRTEKVDGRDYFVLKLKDAAEFMSKKDYTDNWQSEMNEEFAFKSFTEWKKTLADAGFSLIENPNEPEKGSRAYTNPWIEQNWLNGKVALYTMMNGALSRMPNPPTTMVLVGEKG